MLIANQLGFALALFVLLAACGQSVTPSQLGEGRAFPQVALHKVSGGTASPQAYRGKFLVLNIWSVWCVPCRREMPSLERLSKTLDPQRFTVTGLSAENDAQQVQKFLRHYGVTFENFFDRDGATLKQLGIDAYPETLLIAPDGTLVQRVMGEQDWGSPDMIKKLEEVYHAHI